MKIVDKVWGQEVWIVNEAYCGKLLKLRKGYRCSRHYHRTKDETFYLLSGKVHLEISGAFHMLEPGGSMRILPGVVHSFTGLEDSTIIEFSTHHDDADVVRIDQSRQEELAP